MDSIDANVKSALLMFPSKNIYEIKGKLIASIRHRFCKGRRNWCKKSEENLDISHFLILKLTVKPQ